MAEVDQSNYNSQQVSSMACMYVKDKLGIDSEELWKAIKIIAEDGRLEYTVKSSLISGGISGTSTVVGGILLAPFGIPFAGALIGSFLFSL